MDRINKEIKKSLLIDQTNRIKSSKKYFNVKFVTPEKHSRHKSTKETVIDLTKLEESFVTLDRINKMERLSKK